LKPELAKILELPDDHAEKMRVLTALDRMKNDYHGALVVKWLTEETLRLAGRCVRGDGPQLHRYQGSAQVIGNLVDTWNQSGDLLDSIMRSGASTQV
jgi:hypothetical protein